MNTIILNPIVDELIRVRGNKITIAIDKTGKLQVKAPHYSLISDINMLISQKISWIEKHKKRISESQPVRKEFKDGEKFLYVGKELPLRVVNDGRTHLAFKEDHFQLSSGQTAVARQLFERLYKNLAWNYMAPRTRDLAKAHKFSFSSVKISSAKTKWGSCSNKKSINLAWRLVMAPPLVIDYVIIHELAHTLEMNHTSSFWSIVEKIMPDYDINKNWLKNNGNLLDF